MSANALGTAAGPTADCFVSVVAPLHDDADIVAAFVREVAAVLAAHWVHYELVLVDDGSTDATRDIVAGLLPDVSCIRLIHLSRRFGRDVAISAGLDTVIGDFVVVLLPESDPPELIPQFVEACRAGAGLTYGIRARRPAESPLLSVGTRVFYWYFNRVLGIDLPRNSTDFRGYSRQSVNAITRIKDRLRYLRTFGSQVGSGGRPLVYEPRFRRAKSRGRTPGEALGLAINMTVANSTQPLRMASVAGLVLSLVCFAHVAYVLVVRISAPDVMPGWATQQILSSTMFGFLFVILATLCEYLGRLLGEVKERPLYFVLEERSSTVMLLDEQRRNVVTDPLREVL